MVMISAKKQKKTIEQKRLEISSRKLEGNFHAKMGTIKDRNDKDLPEAEEIKKRWREYTKVPYKKGPNDSANHDGVVAHLEPDIWSVTSSGLQEESV